jgi:hypothetical protein
MAREWRKPLTFGILDISPPLTECRGKTSADRGTFAEVRIAGRAISGENRVAVEHAV